MKTSSSSNKMKKGKKQDPNSEYDEDASEDIDNNSDSL